LLRLVRHKTSLTPQCAAEKLADNVTQLEDHIRGRRRKNSMRPAETTGIRKICCEICGVMAAKIQVGVFCVVPPCSVVVGCHLEDGGSTDFRNTIRCHNPQKNSTWIYFLL